jgi:hypothetical protein
VPGGLYIGDWTWHASSSDVTVAVVAKEGAVENDGGAATWRARERDGSMSRVTYLTRPPSFGCARAEKKQSKHGVLF